MSVDITAELERRLVWQGVLQNIIGDGIDVLKVTHYGSKDGTTEELLDVLKPKMAVISVGAKNRFGNPTKEVLVRLKEKNIKIRRTDKEGNVIIF